MIGRGIVRSGCKHRSVQPFRFATLVATTTAVVVGLGQLWLRSLDTRITVIDPGAGFRFDAVGGVSVAGLPGTDFGASRRTVAKDATRHRATPKRVAVRQSHQSGRFSTGRASLASAPLPTVSRAVHPASPVAHATPPRVNVAPHPKPKPKPKSPPTPSPKPTPTPTPAPAPTPTPTPAPTPTPTPAPTPQPTPAPAPAPAPAPPAPTPPAPTPVPATQAPAVPADQPAVPASPSTAAASESSRPGWGWGDKNHDHTGPPGNGGGSGRP
jgi:hypothetical protein